MNIREKICEELIGQCNKEAQINYCKSNNVPLFVPTICYNCSELVWEKLDPEQCSSKSITSCPICGHSFCN